MALTVDTRGVQPRHDLVWLVLSLIVHFMCTLWFATSIFRFSMNLFMSWVTYCVICTSGKNDEVRKKTTGNYRACGYILTTRFIDWYISQGCLVAKPYMPHIFVSHCEDSYWTLWLRESCKETSVQRILYFILVLAIFVQRKLPEQWRLSWKFCAVALARHAWFSVMFDWSFF